MKHISRLLLAIVAIGINPAWSQENPDQGDRSSQKVYSATSLECVLDAAAIQEEASALACASQLLDAANQRRGSYENDDLPRTQKRALGRELDLVAKHGLRILEQTPESSERYRLEADLLSARLRSKFLGMKLHKQLEAATAKALDLDPDNPLALLTASRRPLFAASEHGGNHAQAVEYLSRAIEVDPNFARAWLYRGIAQHRLGNEDAAAADWEKALALDPSLDDERDRLMTIEAHEAGITSGDASINPAAEP